MTPVERFTFLHAKYGIDICADARPLDGWRGMGHPELSHQLDFCEVLLVDDGRGTILLDSVRHDIVGPQVVVTTPARQRRVLVDNAFEGWLVVFSTVSRGRAIASGAWTIERPAIERLRQIAALLQAELRHPLDDTPAMVEALVSELSIVLRRSAPREAARTSWEPDALTRLDALIEDGFRTEHRASSYADAIGLTLDHLSAVTRAHRGCSVKALLQRRMFAEARRLLLETQLNVAEIAFLLGYAEPAHFARMFRRASGVSPARFRSGARLNPGAQRGMGPG